VGTWKLRVAESIRPVSPFAYTTGIKPASCPALSGAARKALLWPLPTAGHGVHKPPGRRRSQPARDRRILSAPGTADIPSAPGTTDISLALPAIG